MTFVQFLRAFKSLWGGAAIAAASGPLILWASELDPPWPPGSASKIAALFCAAALMLTYIFVHSLADERERTKKRGRTRINQLSYLAGFAFLMIGLAMLIAYLWIYSTAIVADTIQTPPGHNVIVRKIVGDTVREGVIVDGKSNLDLLRDHLYEEDRIWTEESLRKARMSLLTTFLLAFFFLTFGAALLASMNRAAYVPRIVASGRNNNM